MTHLKFSIADPLVWSGILFLLCTLVHAYSLSFSIELVLKFQKPEITTKSPTQAFSLLIFQALVFPSMHQKNSNWARETFATCARCTAATQKKSAVVESRSDSWWPLLPKRSSSSAIDWHFFAKILVTGLQSWSLATYCKRRNFCLWKMPYLALQHFSYGI